jgi:hypothetical protein
MQVLCKAFRTAMSQASRKTLKSEKEDRKGDSGFVGHTRPHTRRLPPVGNKLVRRRVDFP